MKHDSEANDRKLMYFCRTIILEKNRWKSKGKKYEYALSKKPNTKFDELNSSCLH